MNPKVSLAIGLVAIAFSPIFVKLAGADGIASAFYRILISWLMLLPYCVVKKKLAIARKDVMLALLAGIVFATDIAVWNTSILMISTTVSTLLANLAPVWVGVISFIFLRKKSGGAFWLGTLVAIAGMVILVGWQDLIKLKLSLGMALAVLASLLYATYILITKGVLNRVGTVTFMFYSMLSSSVYLLIISLAKQTNLIHYPAKTWVYFLGMGAICQLLGWITINYAIGKLSATKASVALLSQTVLTGIIAAVLLGERLDIKEIVGSAIVLVGIGVTFVKSNELRKLPDIVD